MSTLARVPPSRTTKDVDLASQQAVDLAEAERALADLVDVVSEPAGCVTALPQANR